jgi:glycosyltransferase involved in cell wall biosynthesis
MRVIVVTEAHFQQDSNGRIYSDTGGRGYDFWTRYLDVFDSVNVVARVSPQSGTGAALVEGPQVKVTPLIGYHGPVQYFRYRRQLQKQIRSAYAREMACIARVPGILSTLLINEAHRNRRPYGLEVVGDPHDAFSPGAIQHPLRSFFRQRLTAQMQRQCAEACAVAYVTKQHLQKGYPAASGAFTTNYSSVELPDSAFVAAPRLISRPLRNATLIQVGTLSQLYKGHDVLIDALAMCEKQGYNLRLNVVGDGKHRNELETRVKSLGLNEKVQFLGQLPSGEAIRQQLDKADLFMMPSRTEGLPRAMIEAMARALPCIGSKVGGIPELLPTDDMVPAGDVKALADKICEVLGDPQRMSAMSLRNLEEAREYSDDELRKRRVEFYQQVKARTEAQKGSFT